MAEATTQEQPVLSFNDQNYVIDDLSDQAKYIVAQLQDLEQQLTGTRARLDQLEVAKNGFTNLLQEELEKPDEPEDGATDAEVLN